MGNAMVCSRITSYTPRFAQHCRALMPKSSPPPSLPASFEEAMAELEQLVARMEAGELPLEASVAAYKRGSELVRYCAGQLDRVEAQVKVLEGEMLKPFASTDADEGGNMP
jgi:exodeoxyribonuclease VII small subunit